MRFLLAVILAVSLIFLSGYMPPTPIEKLWELPLDPVKATIHRSYQQDGLLIDEVYYQSKEYKGKPAKIFAYFCRPISKKKLPAILISHGGGGCAHLGRTKIWAQRGYAVLTLDLPGKGENRAVSRSTGPDMDVPTLLTTTPDPSNNYLVHAVAAIRNGITYLTQREEVDPERIGMVGLSWGGVLTLLTNGQDQRLKTVVNVFGAGYIPEACTWQTRFEQMSKEELEQWDTLIDPKNFLKTQHAPIFFITGTNDHCYYLPIFQKSFADVTVDKKLYLVPNLRHKFFSDTQQVVWSWLDSQLKNNSSFPEIDLLPIYIKDHDKIIIPVKVSSAETIKQVTLHTNDGPPSGWTKKIWVGKAGYCENGTYFFSIPIRQIAPEILFFVSAEDDNNAIVSTQIISIFWSKLKGKKTLGVSSPIIKVYNHEPPIQFLEKTGSLF